MPPPPPTGQPKAPARGPSTKSLSPAGRSEGPKQPATNAGGAEAKTLASKSPSVKRVAKVVSGMHLGRSPPAPAPTAPVPTTTPAKEAFLGVSTVHSNPGTPVAPSTAGKLVSFAEQEEGNLKPSPSASVLQPQPSLASSASSASIKKAAPKTLREVADQYNFTLQSVIDANPSLIDLGPDDQIPKGTKLALPKRNASNTATAVSSPETVTSGPTSPITGTASSPMLKTKKSAVEIIREKQDEARRAQQEQQEDPSASVRKAESGTIQKSASMAPKPAAKKAPKCLREVSEMYDFPLVEVYEANPDLLHLAPDDKIPLGTKLVLPKKKPTWIQVVAQLSIHESQGRAAVQASFEKEDDNFWYLLKLEKKSLMKQWDEWQVVWREHKGVSEDLMRDRLSEIKKMSQEEQQQRIAILSKEFSHNEDVARADEARVEDEAFALLLEMHAYFTEVNHQYSRDIAQLQVDHEATLKEHYWTEETALKHLLQQTAIDKEMVLSLDPSIYVPEVVDRDAIRDVMMKERAIVISFLDRFKKLRQDETTSRQVVDDDEVKDREAVDAFSVKFRAFIQSLFDARREIARQHAEQHAATAQVEADERTKHRFTLDKWTKKMVDFEAAAKQLFKEEADAEAALMREIDQGRQQVRPEMMRHRDWVQSKLNAQQEMRADETERRGVVFDEWVEEYRLIMADEAPARAVGLHNASRTAAEDEEASDRHQLTEMALQMHAAARHFFDAMRDLVQEAIVSHEGEQERLCNEAREEYEDCAGAVSRDEALARRNNVLSVEGDARNALGLSIRELHNIARRLWTLEQDIVKGEESASWQMQIDEGRDWDRLIAWNAKRVKMIEEGKTEVDLFIAEEEQIRAELIGERDQDRFRLSTLAAESVAFVNRKLAEQRECYEQETQGRGGISDDETVTRNELAQMRAEEGRKAWREYMERMFVELVARIEAGEEAGRPPIIDEETQARRTLIADEKTAHVAAKAEEAARLLRERLIAEMKERHRRERMLVERSCASEAETVEHEWRSLAFAMFRDMGIIRREEVERSGLSSSEDLDREQLARDRFEGCLRVEREAVETESLVERRAIQDEEEEGYVEWRRVRLAAHYEIWQREIAERLRLQALHRAEMEAEETGLRNDTLREEYDAWQQFLQDEKDGVKEAHRLEQVHAEELRRAIKEWQERMWFARKKLSDEEQALRQDEMLLPEQEQWTRLSNAEGRARHKAQAAGEERVRKEREAEEARIAEARRKIEEEQRRRQAELEAELARQREVERKRLAEKQAQQRARFEGRETSVREDIITLRDNELEDLAAKKDADKQVAHNRRIDRETAAHAAVLAADEEARRQDIISEFEESLSAFFDHLEVRYQDSLVMVHENRLKRVWTVFVSSHNVEAAIDLEMEEFDERQRLANDYQVSYRAWVDAIAIEERMIELAGRRRTTQMLMALCEEEFEERGLLVLLEGLLRMQIEEPFDRMLLCDWEERCTDALHAHAIDTIDAFLMRTPWSNPLDGPLILMPTCLPRPEFPIFRIPSLAASSVALTPRPPLPVLSSISTTPGRLQHRVRSYELQGEAGTPRHLYSMMERFDAECRSEASTPFSLAGSPRGLQSSQQQWASKTASSLPPLALPSPSRTAAIEAPPPRTPKPPSSATLPPPPLTATRFRSASNMGREVSPPRSRREL